MSVITVPTGGWTWDIDLSSAAQYDTNITGTVAAGDYFLSGDNQSDDLLYALQDSIQTEIDGSAVTGDICIGFDNEQHKLKIQFYGTGFVDATGDNDVRINWDSWTAGLLQALGQDGTAAETSTATDNPIFYTDWHVGYNWYADEDGQVSDIVVADIGEAFSLQGKSISGKVKTQFFGDSYTNFLELKFLERYEQGRTKVFSDGVAYGAAPVWPYNRNEPLECWWLQARKGKRFRVYRDGYVRANNAAGTGTSSACNTTILTDAAKSWSVEPFRWPGRVVYIGAYSPSVNQMFYIASSTATSLTVANAHPSGDDVDGNTGGAAGGAYTLYDLTYDTYVLDLKRMKSFNPRQVNSAQDRYNITIPLLRYVA